SRSPVPKTHLPARTNSVDASTGFLDDPRPARLFFTEEGAELGGRGTHRLDRGALHEALHRGGAQCDSEFAVQPFDHRRWSALRREYSHPHVELVALQTRLDHRWNLGRGACAPCAGYGKRPRPAFTDVPSHRGEARHRGRDLPAEQIG